MNNELIMGKSAQPITKKEENPNVKGIFSPIFSPLSNEEFSIGITALLNRCNSENIIAVGDGSSDRSAAIVKWIFGNKSGLLHNLLNSLLQLLQTRCKPYGSSKVLKNEHSLLNLINGTSFDIKPENMINKAHYGLKRTFPFLFPRINPSKYSFFDPVIL
jgi:hypothetical protein